MLLMVGKVGYCLSLAYRVLRLSINGRMLVTRLYRRLWCAVMFLTVTKWYA